IEFRGENRPRRRKQLGVYPRRWRGGPSGDRGYVGHRPDQAHRVNARVSPRDGRPTLYINRAVLVCEEAGLRAPYPADRTIHGQTYGDRAVGWKRHQANLQGSIQHDRCWMDEDAWLRGVWKVG